ncbi:hypothetical protein [Undibacterium sp. TS12]|uniref:hypothetical protein n=1 Tax=Undibacterium sp. TS12 TaxID=2908202 RepID=UPI001F4CEC11|nr:hypothetical protein [Undibacterium sp. TS12]MCH8622615.1 hypothetical protein [Undibacterium sp. TS12]
MALKGPMCSADFQPDPTSFLAVFDIYDREESLGVELAKYDPNDFAQLNTLMRDFYFSVKDDFFKPEHKAELIRVLAEALHDNSYDFAALVVYEYNEYISLPDTWEIHNPRQFFRNIYTIASEHWKNDLESIGRSPEPVSNFA